ncbi:MAG: alpha/beta hydrolase [Acidobacteriota bacterium]
MATLSPVQIEQTLESLLRGRTVLMLPGWNGSGPDHWQTLWEHKYPSLKRVEQRSWAEPRLRDWIDAISDRVWQADAPVVLVAHSLACIALAHWANKERSLARSVEAALLVTPADVEDPARSPAALRSFAPIARVALPFPSTLVASENDPYMSVATAKELAADWGSTFVNAGPVGHINCASGHGSWPEGEQQLASLIEQRT